MRESKREREKRKGKKYIGLGKLYGKWECV